MLCVPGELQRRAHRNFGGWGVDHPTRPLPVFCVRQLYNSTACGCGAATASCLVQAQAQAQEQVQVQALAPVPVPPWRVRCTWLHHPFILFLQGLRR